MTVWEFTAVVGFGSLVAGFLGALTGLGGGVVIVPLLVLGLGVDLNYAVGASLVAVIATSSGAAATYVREGYSNIRIGMSLEIATTLGGVTGALLAARVSGSAVAIVFGIMLLVSAYLSLRRHPQRSQDRKADPVAAWLRLDGSYPTGAGPQHYHVHHIPAGFGLMFGAGVLSGLLGIGSGALKVLALDQAMGIPFKVSTTTSNFMIGVTAAASAGIYLAHGKILPDIALPVVLGVLLGSMLGARVLMEAPVRTLRFTFAAVIVALGLQMIYKGMTGGL